MERKIITTHVYPPIPTRTMDWCAYYDGEEEAGHYGWGRTEADAIDDFKENYAEDHDERLSAVAPVAVSVKPLTDAEVKQLWRQNGGGQHGPHVETYDIPEVGFFGFVVDLEARILSSIIPATKGGEVEEQPGFTYYECPECGFDVIHKADYVPRSTACPICAGDSGHDVGMRSRTARATDKPEGKDARPAALPQGIDTEVKP